jgi:hypothetical protein
MSTLEQALELAARDLPDGWEISINVERGSGSVFITDPDGDSDPMNCDDLSIVEMVEEAVRIAKKKEGKS